MSRFEDEVRQALQREEPSPDFTARVMARIQTLENATVAYQQKQQEQRREENNWRQKLADFFRPPALKWAMAGAMAIALIAVAFGVLHYRERQMEAQRQAEIAEGERAKEQVMLAMRIASSKLNVAQKKVNEAARREDEQPLAGHQPN